MFSAMALVSVAVPYSSVPHTYNVTLPQRRENRAKMSADRTQPMMLPK